jgi:hypothetical protein
MLGHATVTPVDRSAPLEPEPDMARRAPIEGLDRPEVEGTLVGAVQLGLF